MVRTKFTKWLNLHSWPQDGRVRLRSCRIPPQRGAVEADRDKCPGWGQDTAFPTCAGEPLNYGVPYLHSPPRQPKDRKAPAPGRCSFAGRRPTARGDEYRGS